jgi:class 3 adenylate cyclase/pimeloyl-ACP methyl ester carboxylesterase
VDVPDTRYAKSGDLHIAYQVVGNGAVDLVHVPGLLDTLEIAWSDPGLTDLYQRIGRFARLILLDKRGTGLSDRLAPGKVPSLEERSDDIRAVMDAAGSQKAALMGVADGGPIAMYFAAAHPDRTIALVLRATTPRLSWAPDWPWGTPPDVVTNRIETVERDWGTGMSARFWGIDDEETRRRMARRETLAGTPRTVAAVFRTIYETDVRDVLDTIVAPTLVVHYAGHPIWPAEAMRYLAEHITDARYVEFPAAPERFGEDLDQSIELVALLEEQLTGVRPAPEPERVLKTVLFTDIVGSTEKAAEIGDRRWHELLDEHDAAIRRELERFRGQEVKATGDGFLAAFDGPARAIRCARAIADGAHGLGFEIRAGLHTGECELRGDDLAGIAVHTGARVASLAGPGEVLVTSTVRDLVAGSGIEFTDRGRHELKGVPGEWQVLAVQA